MARPAPIPIPDIVEEQLDEAAFLWTQRLAALASSAFSIDEVAAGPEERLLAHLEGVAVGGAAAEAELLVPAIVGSDRDRAGAAAAVLAMGRRLDPLRAAVPAAEPNRPVIALALATFLPRGEEPRLLAWLESGDPALAAVALGVLVARDKAPAPEVRRALRSDDLALQEAGLRGCSALGDTARPEIEAALGAPDPRIRTAAVEAGLALGLRAAWQACQRAADAGAPSPLDLEVLAMSGAPDDLARIEVAARTPAHRAAALFAAGLSGRVAAADLGARFLDDAVVAPVAAEAIRAVAGLTVEGAYRAPEPEEPASLADGATASVDRALPWPEPEAVRSWWSRARAGLAEGQRWLEGQPFDPDVALRAFAYGSTRRRAPLARELALRSRGEYRIDVTALAHDQLRRASELRLVARPDFGQPFSRLLRP